MVANFVGERESPPVWVVTEVQNDDGDAVLYERHARELIVKSCQLNLDAFSLCNLLYRHRQDTRVSPSCSFGFSFRLDRVVRRHYLSRRERSEEHTSELQSLMRISYAVFCL